MSEPPPPVDLTGLDAASGRLVALVLRILSGDFAARGEVSGSGDGSDAVTVALNMLAESFEHERSARERAEALLADAVDSYDLAAEGFCSCDAESLAIVKCNGTLGRLLGTSPDALLSSTLIDHLAPTSRMDAREAIAGLAAVGSMPSVDLEFQTAGGGSLVASVTGALKRDPEGRPLRVLLALRDETHSRKLAQQLIEAQRLDALGKLAGGIAHDFNNLLLVIDTTAALLSTRLSDRPRELEDVRVVRETAERAAVLTRDLLAFARQEPGSVRSVLVDEAIARSEPVLRRLVGSALKLEVDARAPLASVVTGNGHLGQVLVNLVVNACDATPPGGRITIRSRPRQVQPDEVLPADSLPGDYVEIRVQDSGPGIPEAIRARIFEPFFTTKPIGRGTGLGLSIVQGLVHRAGGSVWVEAAQGGGACFTVLLPRAPTRSTAPTAAAGTDPRSEASTLLVVDDDDRVRGLVVRVLQEAGYRTLSAADGESAVAMFREHQAEVRMVVSDVSMPVMDGLATLRALRALRPTLPCLFITGYAHGELRLRSLPRVDVLEKPFEPPALLDALRNLAAAD